MGANGGADVCIESGKDCPAGATKMTSMSQCAAKHFTSAASSNCGTTTTMGAAALTPEEKDGAFVYQGHTKAYTVEGKKSCLVKIDTGFSDPL